jgi:hypothetical protein
MELGAKCSPISIKIFLTIYYYLWEYAAEIMRHSLEVDTNYYDQERKGGAMKFLGILILIVVVLSGCASFQRSEVIDTDKLGGFASGTYSDNSSGPSGTLRLVGSGAGWGAGGGGGLGAAGIGVQTGPPPSGSYNFARSIAMINYSKKLKSIKYDEFGGVIDYEFEQTPLSSVKTTRQDPGTKPKLPSSFGHQPVE